MLELDVLGAEYGLLTPGTYPVDAHISQHLGSAVDLCEYSLDGGAIVRSCDVGAVWYRKPAVPALHPSVVEHEREYAFNEARAGLRGVYDSLSHAFWFSHVDRIRSAGNKLAQLRAASRQGMGIPRTVFTNDPAVARDFVAAADGRVVFKSIGDGMLSTRGGPWESPRLAGDVYTTLVDEAMLEAGLERLAACPVLLQEYVEKDVELRITVVGDEVFAAEIHSQANASGGEIDWRRGSVSTMEYRVHELPDRERDQCLALVRAFGLQYGAIDMVKRPDGRYVFLEINPNGQYGWIEDKTGLQLSRAIAQRLVAGHDAVLGSAVA
jgi:hypothetical protein